MRPLKTSLMLHDGMTSPLRHITSGLNIVINSFESLQATSRNAIDVSSLQYAREELARADTKLDAMEQGLKSAGNQQERFNSSVRAGSGAYDGLLSKARSLAATVGGMMGAQKVLNLSDQMAGNSARLSLIVDDGGSVQALEQKIMASAQRSRASYLDTAQSVAKLGLMAGDAFHGNDEMIRFSELMNKNFIIAGASAQEQSAAMYQLNQAMGSGRLQGDEFRSIIENAPLLARSIEDYMRNVQGAQGAMKDWSSAGLLTADVIKNALFMSADEVEERFSRMPKTWAQVWTSMKNRALSVFSPILKRINEVANTTEFENLTNGLIKGLAAVAAGLSLVFGLTASVGSALYDNWGWIAPIVWGVVAAMGAYYGAVLAMNTVQMVSNGLKTIAVLQESAHAAALAMSTGQTFAATAAQYGLNAALYACPLTWVVLAIIAVIAVIYLAVGVINHFADTSYSATGLIMGAFYSLAAYVMNNFIRMHNFLVSFANFFGNLFHNPVAAVKVLFYDLAQTVIGYVLNMARAIEALVNSIPGVEVNITGGLDSFYKNLEEASRKVKDESGWVEYVQKMEYKDFRDYAKAGYAFGEGIDRKVSSLFSDHSKAGVVFGEGNTDIIANGVSETAGNTAAMRDALEITEEDLAYMRDIAEREAINRFTTAEITVHQNNENHISKDTDLDGIMNAWSYQFAEKLENSPEGVHA